MNTHIVICRGDRDQEEGHEGLYEISSHYELATRTVFDSREAAEAYASTIASCRAPIVVRLPIDELRVGEERGTLDYWKRGGV